MKEDISRGAVALVHPITGTYFILEDDGHIRMGGENFGDFMFWNAVTGELLIKATKVRYITDELEWNELTFNKAATNPTQPALSPRKASPLKRELARYGD